MGGPAIPPRRIGLPINPTVPDPRTAPRSVQAWNDLSYEELRDRLLPNYLVNIADWLKSYIHTINKEYTITLDALRSPVQPDFHARVTSRPRPKSSSENGDDASEISSIDDDDQNYSLALEAANTIEDKDFERCFSLVESTSAADYRASAQKWSPRKKRNEMHLLDMRFLLLKTRRGEIELGSIRGFISFMITIEDGHEVIYIYELHIAEEIQKKGVGKWMMQQVEKIGRRAKMEKAMLTVFKSNGGACRFYKGMGYEVDEFSPEPTVLRGGRKVEADYEILSKVLGEEVDEDEEVKSEGEEMKMENEGERKVKVEDGDMDEPMYDEGYPVKAEKKEEQDDDYKIKLEEA